MKLIVKHSKSKNAWNVVNRGLGEKYKIARFPYLVIPDADEMNEYVKNEAFELANIAADAINKHQ
tara:strand:+ start:1158 stop:1352 length:195 start_codon:yes stop_codon:yes gene_type:complete